MAEEAPDHSPPDDPSLPPLAKVAPLPSPGQEAFPPLYPADGTTPPPPPVSPFGLPYGPPPGYSTSAQRLRRPPVLTAIAVASIVVSILGILGAAIASVAATGFLIVNDAFAAAQSQNAANMSSDPPAATAATVKASPGLNGMDDRDRETVILAVGQLEPIPESRRQQLDLLLTLAGKTLFPKAGGLLSGDAIEAMVTNHGEMFSEKVDAQGTSYFITKGGRLDLYDDRAVFRPSDGSATVRVSTTPPAPVGLTADEVQSVVSQVQSAGAKPLNAPQGAALHAMLIDPGQDLVPTERLSSAVTSTAVESGVVTIRFVSGRVISLDARGQTVAPGAAPPPQVSRFLFGGLIVLVGLTFVMAIYLLVGGIRMLRDRFAPAGRMHRRYAWIELAAAAGIVIVAIWMRGDFTARVSAALGAGAAAAAPDTRPWAIALIAVTALGLVYPVILLILLRVRKVRQHLDPLPVRP